MAYMHIKHRQDLQAWSPKRRKRIGSKHLKLLGKGYCVQRKDKNKRPEESTTPLVSFLDGGAWATKLCFVGKSHGGEQGVEKWVVKRKERVDSIKKQKPVQNTSPKGREKGIQPDKNGGIPTKTCRWRQKKQRRMKKAESGGGLKPLSPSAAGGEGREKKTGKKGGTSMKVKFEGGPKKKI